MIYQIDLFFRRGESVELSPLRRPHHPQQHAQAHPGEAHGRPRHAGGLRLLRKGVQEPVQPEGPPAPEPRYLAARNELTASREADQFADF